MLKLECLMLMNVLYGAYTEEKIGRDQRLFDAM